MLSFFLTLRLKSTIKPRTNTKEKMNNALLYPPKAVTITPTNNTAVAVNNRPTLKQNPVAVARIETGNNNGINALSTPWLAPKKNANTAISANTAILMLVFVLKRMTDKMAHAEKQSNIDRCIPRAFANQPDTKPPVKPPIPNNIILIPRSFCASAAVDKL